MADAGTRICVGVRSGRPSLAAFRIDLGAEETVVRQQLVTSALSSHEARGDAGRWRHPTHQSTEQPRSSR